LGSISPIRRCRKRTLLLHLLLQLLLVLSHSHIVRYTWLGLLWSRTRGRRGIKKLGGRDVWLELDRKLMSSLPVQVLLSSLLLLLLLLWLLLRRFWVLRGSVQHGL
jgi:hypothetical protein